jgi:hypothetical protein
MHRDLGQLLYRAQFWTSSQVRLSALVSKGRSAPPPGPVKQATHGQGSRGNDKAEDDTGPLLRQARSKPCRQDQ